ncbi:MAG: Na/Pi cotransporter family protein, partial [Saprospiraceae bacterium]
MMGANIGTTITGWLISILGFKVKLSVFSIPIFAFALPMIFIKKGKIRFWGEFFIGFAILFMGLSELKASVPNIKSNPEVLNFLAGYANLGFLSSLFFVFVGTLLTIIVQSSTAAMALTMTLCYTGIIPFEVATAMILGENIGTTITAELASIVGNVHAKRSARIHSLFNLIGVTWAILAMPLLVKLVTWISTSLLGSASPYDDPEAIPIALSIFHTLFNFTNVVLLIGFVPVLVNLATKSVKSKGEEDEDYRLEYIGASIKTPELSILEVQKEVAKFGEITARMSGFTQKLLKATEAKKQRKMLKKLEKYEEITDKIEIELTEYLTKLSKEEVSHRVSIRMRSILNICNDLERIGDIYYQISKSIEQKIEAKIWFNQDQRDRLDEMNAFLDEAFEIMVQNISSPHYDTVNIDPANAIEQKINAQRDLMRKENTEKIGEEDYNVKSAMVYNNIFSSLEKIGDHMINVTEAVTGQI